MSDFHTWRKAYMADVLGESDLTEVEWHLIDMELCWNSATKEATRADRQEEDTGSTDAAKVAMMVVTTPIVARQEAYE